VSTANLPAQNPHVTSKKQIYLAWKLPSQINLFFTLISQLTLNQHIVYDFQKCFSFPLNLLVAEYFPLGRRRRRWGENIRMDLRKIGWGRMDWIVLARDRDQWRALVNTVMNLRVS
jgi:hypothetical protein